MYSAPPGSGVLYWTHSPAVTMTAWPALTIMLWCLNLICSAPFKTSEYSLNSGVWPGSSQPSGLTILAMLTSSVPVLTRPMNSWIGIFREITYGFDQFWLGHMFGHIYSLQAISSGLMLSAAWASRALLGSDFIEPPSSLLLGIK